jgi:4-amino-4-deoxychorismate mutase
VVGDAGTDARPFAQFIPNMESSVTTSQHRLSATVDDLETLRSRLDGIDERLLECLRERIACCVAIADVKRRDDVAMMQPHRIAVVQERAARYGAEHGIDGDFLRSLYDLIIAETCRVEDLIIASGPSHAG